MFAKSSFLFVCVILLGGCGGGGGGGASSSPVSPESPVPAAYTVTCGNGALAVSATSATDTTVCPTPNTSQLAPVPPSTGNSTTVSTSSTPSAINNNVAYLFGSLVVRGHSHTSEFKPCTLTNISNSAFVYSCIGSGSPDYMSFSFANDSNGKVQFSVVNGANYSLHNNYYGTQFATNDRQARRITLNSVGLDLAASQGATTSIPTRITVSGTLTY
jgi:hypothetical protein